MKNISLILVFISIFSCAQEIKNEGIKNNSEVYTYNEIDEMAVLESCKNEVQKEAVKNCFSNYVNMRFTQIYNHKFSNTSKLTGVMKISYIIGKEGKLKEISGQGSQELLPLALEVMNEINQEIIYEPARRNSEKVDLKFAIPIRVN